ncbi:hypothetical protein GH714_006036 [Hevea brasiliensis]|uniref:Uncharacterized protein n=1 Tax=Hevea brasiliensis TaxID=3981 RepID=A0A6A6LEQ9_HEVBR|nr:hypothetical protein GH714_006036 [Hevea brasiliensis]
MVEAEVLVYNVQQYSSRVYTEEEVARNESEPAAATASPLSQKATEAKTYSSSDPKKEIASTKLSEPVAVPPTVIETPLTTKPLKETKEPIQTTTATSDQVIKSSPPPSMIAKTMILPKTKEPIQATAPTSDQELIKSSSLPPSITTETKILPKTKEPIQTTAPTSDQELIKSSSPPPSIATETKILPKTKEPIQTTAPTSDQELIKSSSPPPSIAAETKILPKVLSHLAELKESIPVAATIAKTAQAHRTSLSGKTTDLEARLAQREKKLSFLETEFSRLSKEEEKVEAQFQFLITQKEKILANKKYVLADLEKTNDEALKDLEEWRNLESEIKQVN